MLLAPSNKNAHSHNNDDASIEISTTLYLRLASPRHRLSSSMAAIASETRVIHVQLTTRCSEIKRVICDHRPGFSQTVHHLTRFNDEGPPCFPRVDSKPSPLGFHRCHFSSLPRQVVKPLPEQTRSRVHWFFAYHLSWLR